MKQIKLNRKEFEYLASSSDIPNELTAAIQRPHKENEKNIIILIPEDDADISRNFFIDQLQILGFDENYELNEHGKILEDLIDKFFT
jgi:hypothetical protein